MKKLSVIFLSLIILVSLIYLTNIFVYAAEEEPLVCKDFDIDFSIINSDDISLANIEITNTGESGISDWVLAVDTSPNAKLINCWDGFFTQSGSPIIIYPVPDNNNIPVGEKIKLGFTLYGKIPEPVNYTFDYQLLN